MARIAGFGSKHLSQVSIGSKSKIADAGVAQMNDPLIVNMKSLDVAPGFDLITC